MKARFRITNPNMLAEAQAADLFVPLGPDLVECVCALRCVDGADGVRTDMPGAARFDPDAPLGVVVIACRVGLDEPEYYPPGYTTMLSGAAPIQFLQQREALHLQPRTDPASMSSASLTSLAEHQQRDAVESLRGALLAEERAHGPLPLPHDLARAELASKL